MGRNTGNVGGSKNGRRNKEEREIEQEGKANKHQRRRGRRDDDMIEGRKGELKASPGGKSEMEAWRVERRWRMEGKEERR